MEPTGHWFKVVNSDDVPAVGIAWNVKLHASDWKGKFSIEIISLDEYNLILILELFNTVNAMINMRTKSIVITNRKCPLVVPMIFELMEARASPRFNSWTKGRELRSP